MVLMRSIVLSALILASWQDVAIARGEKNPSTVGASLSRRTYQLGGGDKLRIITFGEDKFSGEFLVSGEGFITFPLLGPISVAGQTAADVAMILTQRLEAEYLREPKVSVEIINFRPIYILGEVSRPGEYPFVEGMTFYIAVAKAGGFTYRANSRRAYVRHENETQEKRIRIDSGTAVFPGDTIRIPQSYF